MADSASSTSKAKTARAKIVNAAKRVPAASQREGTRRSQNGGGAQAK